MKLPKPSPRRKGRGRPFTGAWIETGSTSLKSSQKKGRPFTGAWIETSRAAIQNCRRLCRPFTGAWIETLYPLLTDNRKTVAPSRGRGLKLSATEDGEKPYQSPLHGGVD